MVRPSPVHIVPQRSEGYTPGPHGYLEIGDLGGAVGAGTVYTTIGDLQTWVENYRDPRVGNTAIAEEMMTPYVLNDGEETSYGYGLSVDEQGAHKRVHHGGADVAHRSMPVYYPELGAGATVQSNNAQFGSSVAFRIAEKFFEELEEDEEPAVADAAAPAEEPAPAEWTPADFHPGDFDDFAGRYALDESPSFVMTFTRDGETFYAQATGQPRLEMVPTSDSTFALQGVEASVAFRRDEDGAVEGLTLHQNGERHATRLEGDAEEWAPGAQELEEFAGRYFSREIETFYTLAVEDGELVLHHRRMDDAPLEPGEKDRFSGGGFDFAFERDRNGRLIGFYLANGRTRDVRFQRVF